MTPTGPYDVRYIMACICTEYLAITGNEEIKYACKIYWEIKVGFKWLKICTRLFCQQMHCLLEPKILQFTQIVTFYVLINSAFVDKNSLVLIKKCTEKKKKKKGLRICLEAVLFWKRKVN